MKPISPTREQWLQSAISDLRPDIKHAGLILPRIVHVSIGFPSTRALVSSRRRLGECWQGEASRDGNPHIYISPVIESGTEVLAALIHELVHAAGIRGHMADFKRPALALGLTGKMTSTVPGPDLTSRLNDLIRQLGKYPHNVLDPQVRPTKKQSTRLLKATCEECEAIIRVTGKVVNDPGLPTCACGGMFELA